MKQQDVSMASPGVVQEKPDADHINLEGRQTSERSEAERESNSETEGFSALEKWNHPRINMFRLFATLWSFLVMGANDAAYGVSAALDNGLIEVQISNWAIYRL